MNRAVRLKAILDQLASQGEVTVEEVIERFDVSPATARRDLDSLAEQRLVTRTHGGASRDIVAYDLPQRYRRGEALDEKSRIAHVAASMVPLGAVVGLCGGTTTRAIAAALSTRDDIMAESTHPTLTVVTNAINIAVELSMRPQIKIVVIGGVVNPRTYELVGDFTDPVLDTISLDIAFVGANGLDPVEGALVHDEREASVNRRMGQRARQAVLVADSSKIGKPAFARVGGSDIFPTLITDTGVTAPQRALLREAGYEVLEA